MIQNSNDTVNGSFPKSSAMLVIILRRILMIKNLSLFMGKNISVLHLQNVHNVKNTF